MTGVGEFCTSEVCSDEQQDAFGRLAGRGADRTRVEPDLLLVPRLSSAELAVRLEIDHGPARLVAAVLAKREIDLPRV